MALMSWTVAPGPILHGSLVTLRPPQMNDYEEWAELRGRSRAHLEPWEPQWTHDELTRAAFRRRVRRYLEMLREGVSVSLFIFRQSDNALVGGINIANIRRGVAQMANIGYWIGEPYGGRGYMADAVRVCVSHAFDGLGLHRVEAACLPSNEASRRVLARVGFREEGFARAYLRINGAWEDHILHALVNGDPILPASGP